MRVFSNRGRRGQELNPRARGDPPRGVRALRDPWTRRGARGRRRREETGRRKPTKPRAVRALPRRWLARWRAFAFAKGAKQARAPGALGSASTAWRPSLSSLREATEELFCPHGGLAAPGDLYRPRGRNENGVADDDDAAALDAEKTRVLRAVFGDGPPRTNERTTTHDKKRTTTGDDRDILPVSSRLELELVPAAAAAALEATLRRRVRAPGCFRSGPGLGRSRRRRARRARAPPSVRHRRRS